jgi:hypothetical protein
MEILDWQKLRLAACEPLGAGQRLAFGTMPVPAGNGELTITCIMRSLS